MVASAGDPNRLGVDFEVMRKVAAATDARNEEIRAMLQAFIARMRDTPPTVWSGAAAARFHTVVQRWEAESVKLHRALQVIAETIRFNAHSLREAAEAHSVRIASAEGGI